MRVEAPGSSAPSGLGALIFVFALWLYWPPYETHIAASDSTAYTSAGAPSVADPRVEWHHNVLGVLRWEDPSGTVTGEGRPTTGRFAVADLRVTHAFDAGYAVLGWQDAARTIAGMTSVGCVWAT